MERSAAAGRITPWAVLGAAGALIVARAPQLLVEPRLWAEEGVLFLAHAVRSSFAGGLVYVQRDAGYFNLPPSLATAIAAAAPLEAAPWVTTYASLACLLLPLLIILFGRSRVWDDPLRKAVACGIVLLAPSFVGEVWLNTINAQVYLGVAALCLLCEDLDGISGRRLAGYTALLAVCGLSGPYTTFLVFAFLWNAWVQRSRAARVLAGALVLTTAVQGLVFTGLASQGFIHGAKFSELNALRSVSNALHAHFLVPVVGRPVGFALARIPRLLFVLLGFVSLAVALGWLVDWRRRSAAVLLLVALLPLSILTTVASKHGLPGGRYGVLPGIAWLLLILATTRSGSRMRARFAALLLGLGLTAGVFALRAEDPAFGCGGPCPSWPAELARWRADPDYRLRVWPMRSDDREEGWWVDLGRPGQGG